MVRHMTRSIVALVAVLTLVFCLPWPALAQDAPETEASASDAAADPGDSADSLEPIPAGETPPSESCVPLPDYKDPQTALIRKLLGLFEKSDKLDPRYKMHDKLSDEKKDMVRATLLQIDNDMHLLITGRSPLSECYETLRKKQLVIDPETGEKKLVDLPNVEEKKLLARTAGLEKEDDQPEKPDGPGGARSPRVRTTTGGRATPHGTIIYKSRRSRGRGVFHGTRPKVIVIPPPRNRPTPAPQPAPEPAPAPE